MAHSVATNSVMNAQEECLCCPKCKTPYSKVSKPKLLPCLHGYCKDCLDGHIETEAKDGIFKCPECETEIVNEGIDAFQDALFLPTLNEKLAPTSMKFLCHACLIDKPHNKQSKDATMKCLDCDDYLCSDCEKSHYKTKLTKEHKVIKFGDLKNNNNKQDEKVYCPSHKDQVLIFVCDACKSNTPMCRDCKTLQHDGHSTTSIQNALQESKPKIEKCIEEIQQKKPMYSDFANTAEKEMTELDKEEKNVKDKIEARAKKLRDLIDKRENELLKKVSEQVATQREHIKECQQKFQLMTDILDSTADLAEKILNYGKEAEVLIVQDLMIARLQDLRDKQIEIPHEMKLHFNYNEATATELEVQDGLGKVESQKLNRSVRKYQGGVIKLKDKVELKLKFRSGQGAWHPYGLTSSGSDILVTGGKQIKIFNQMGKLKDAIAGQHQAFNALQLANGDILVSCYDSRNITKDNVCALYDKQTKSKFQLLGCRGLALNKNGKKIVVACGKQQKVVIMKPNGAMIKTIDECDGQKFKDPQYVAFMSDGNIVISDKHNHSVNVMYPNGDHKFSYGGQGCGEGQLKHPCGVCVDWDDNIIIADYTNHRIHMINSEGKFIKYLATKQDGIKNPRAVAINSEGDIVVAKNNGTVKVFRYFEKNLPSFESNSLTTDSECTNTKM